MSNELKPCPFCGAKAELKIDITVYRVQCTKCFIGTRRHVASDMWSYEDTKELVIEAWNRRYESEN